MAQRRDFKPRFGDVSIYDYANAQVAGRKGRLSKKVATPIAEVEMLSRRGDGLGWEQRQQRIDDGDAEDVDVIKTTGIPVKGEEESRPYLTLPMDIWFAIGDHIPPECVKSFASICRDTQKVTNSARFWFGLYKRCYKQGDLHLLPKRLQPLNMKGIQGLKACVIRSLFFIYPPFVERLKPRLGRECNLEPLFHRKCISTWYTKKGKVWTFWFKLKQLNPRAGGYSTLLSLRNKKLLQMERDMAANPEKDTKVLQVSCSQYLPLPAVHGLVLRRAAVTVSQDMMANKLTLSFDTIDLVFDPAINIQVLDWWHSQYPHASFEEGMKRNFGFSICDKERSDLEGGVLIDHWYDV